MSTPLPCAGAQLEKKVWAGIQIRSENCGGCHRKDDMPEMPCVSVDRKDIHSSCFCMVVLMLDTTRLCSRLSKDTIVFTVNCYCHLSRLSLDCPMPFDFRHLGYMRQQLVQ